MLRLVGVATAKLAVNSGLIIDQRCRNADWRLLLRNVRLLGDLEAQWQCLPDAILARIVSFTCDRTVARCAQVCHLWCHHLHTVSSVYHSILSRRLREYRRPPPKKVADEHRVAIRTYIDNSSTSPSSTFDKSLAQLQNEGERVAVEHEAVISRLRQVEFDVSKLQNRIKAARRQLGALNVIRGEERDKLRIVARHNRSLVEKVAAMDAQLSARRQAKIEARLQLQDETQEQLAESRRLDVIDQELARLRQVKRDLLARAKTRRIDLVAS